MTLKAVVFGATGLVGAELVRALLNAKIYSKIMVVARRRLSIVHPRLEQHLIQFNELDQCPKEWFSDADVYCTLGTTIKKAGSKKKFEEVDYQYVIELGKLAKRYQARKLLVITAMDASERSIFFYNRVKGKTERELQQLELPGLHILRPSLIVGNRREFRFGEYMLAKFAGWFSFLFVGMMKKYRPIHAKVIAEAMMKIALSKKENQVIFPSLDIEARSKIKLNR